MLTGAYCLFVAITLFLLVMHAMHQEDQRGTERRCQELPHPVERRLQQRREPRPALAFLKWAIKALWS